MARRATFGLATALLCIGAATGTAHGQSVTGVVLVGETGAPLPGAHVIARGVPDGVVAGGVVADALSNRDGRFALRFTSSARIVLEVAYVGYAPFSSEELDLLPGDSLHVEIRMQESAIALQPLAVTVVRRGVQRLHEVGFYTRRSGGQGTFLTHEDIERRQPGVLSDVFTGVRGVSIYYLQGRRDLQFPRSSGGSFSAAGACLPKLYVDDLVVRQGRPRGRLEPGELTLDEIMQVHDVEAIEIYRGTPPPQYQGQGSECGVVVFWTRR